MTTDVVSKVQVSIIAHDDPRKKKKRLRWNFLFFLTQEAEICGIPPAVKGEKS